MAHATTREEVEVFLIGFHGKMTVFEVYFLERKKNLQALLDLEMVPVKRKEILRQLKAEDFYRCPAKDQETGPDLWEFGRIVNGKELYIKVHMGYEGRPVICVSFHIAERPIKYPFK